jgi:hypothetical protein
VSGRMPRAFFCAADNGHELVLKLLLGKIKELGKTTSLSRALWH